MTATENGPSPRDMEAIERVVYKMADDIAVSLSRSAERLEERLDAMESRIHASLAELDDTVQASWNDMSNRLDSRAELVHPSE